MSQPTISSHISSLERDLNIQLFDRTSKEVNLTPAGESFLQYANDIINTRNHAITELSNFNNNISGKLNISASTTPCNSILPTLINKFNELHCNVKFNVKEQGSVGIIKDIIDLNCEIGLVGTSIDNPKIKCYKIMEDELVIVSNPKLNLPDKITIDELLKYSFIIREKESATRQTLESSLSNSHIDLNKMKVLCEVNTLDAQLKFVKLGMGISIMSRGLCEEYFNSGILKLTCLEDICLKRAIYLVVSSKRTLSPIGTAFF
ncbi:LysR substrate-binding domain-containing protein [Clostridium sp. BL8]|uniref:LysR substrate-binding domain-containing protein n=1 Tax=Clostridium sp. BL8 TaxID=1354301 RepID=UPI0004183001|nr:LysR substrate-binding domain-containing protein [Clostridium sp. BL8]